MHNWGRQLFRCANRKRVAILLYHGVTDQATHQGLDNCQGKHIPVGSFRQQMEFLNTHYSPISLMALVDHCTHGKSVPERSVVVTFDDGYLNNYTVAFPVLKALGIPATVFLTTDFVHKQTPLWPDRLEYALDTTSAPTLRIGFPDTAAVFQVGDVKEKAQADLAIRRRLKQLSDDQKRKIVQEIEAQAGVSLIDDLSSHKEYAPMTWQQAREMQRSGLVNFGSHTVSHAILTRCSEEQMNYELAESKHLMEQQLGQPCGLFAYPNGRPGDFNQTTRNALAALGYTCALTTVQDLADGRSDIFALPRMSIKATTSLAAFQSQLSGWQSLRDRFTQFCLRGLSRANRLRRRVGSWV